MDLDAFGKVQAEQVALRVFLTSIALYVKKLANDPAFDETLRQIMENAATRWRIHDGTPEQVQAFRMEIAAIGRAMIDEMARQPIDDQMRPAP